MLLNVQGLNDHAKVDVVYIYKLRDSKLIALYKKLWLEVDFYI